MATSTLLQFEPLACRVEVPFWFELERRKLHEYKDGVFPVTVWGSYSPAGHQPVSSPVAVAAEGFAAPPATPVGFPIQGTLLNTNTLEELKRSDRQGLIAAAGAEVWAAIQEGAWLQRPGLLNRFVLLCYADLKQHRFHHCAGFPVLLPAQPFTRAGPVAPVGDHFTLEQQHALHAGVQQLRSTAGPDGSSAFLVSVLSDSGTVQVRPLAAWAVETASADRAVWVAVADPCAQPTVPGWPLRNLLLALTHHFRLEGVVHVLCYREVPGRPDVSHSITLDVAVSAARLLRAGAVQPDCAGWPQDNKLRLVDLSPLMDEEKLSSSSANLNLSLMKWRMLPSLDLARLENCRCLLIGAGTLGCNVARTLMMWGATQLTFLDYGTVSYSNPVRQTLFEFRDAKEGRPKAQAAADACRRIFPACRAEAVSLAVPMPGHPVDAARREAVQAAAARLEELVRAADAVFLLTDSRESRWLPTVLCATHSKLCINAALGFSSYMVMRHGVKGQPADQRLGCYYCSTITAPRDSLSDRTLDQQCTVTRPGISAIASALAVELLAATLQHPLGAAAPADTEQDAAASLLGLVPHQIRGQVDTFQQSLLHGRAYDKCTACSDVVLEAYAAQGFGFVETVLNNPEVLEDMTGLKQVKEEVDAMLAKMEEEAVADNGSDEEWVM